MLVQGVLTPLRTGVSTLTAQAEKYYNYMFRYEALEAEIEALRQQIAKMEDDSRLAAELARENDRLRELLNMKALRETYTQVDAYIISRSSVEWSSTFTVNRGSAAGIREGMCVITSNEEVVGLVTEVGPNYAVVKTVLDSSLSISASVGGYSGIVQGGHGQNQEGAMLMQYLSTEAVPRNDDQVITAGSTVYPRNLILGYIDGVGYDQAGVAKYAVVRPAADIDRLEQVFIITDFTTE
jgi:rod shape-determining protein MreC